MELLDLCQGYGRTLMKNIISLLIVLTLGILVSTPCLSDEIILPNGWRLPRNLEVQDEWRDKDVNRYLLINADFNGDGIMDEAKLLISDKPFRLALFAFVSQHDGTFKSFLLDEKNDVGYLKSLGIAKVSRGRYKTACGKGIIECRKDETDEVFLQYNGIEYFKVESASMYFYWDSSTKTFKKAWIDD